jgi:hypothetical protein
MYEACPESKDTKVLNMYNIFNLLVSNKIVIYNCRRVKNYVND